MKQKLLLLLMITAATGRAQYDTLKQKSSYIICLGYKSDCKPGSVTENKRTGLGDTVIAFVSGQVVDAQNVGIPFAELRFTNTQSHEVMTCTTSLNGFYKTWIKAGQYQVKAAYFKYKPLEATLSLGTGELRLLNISLGESCCGLTKTVISEGKSYREEYNSNTQLCQGPPPIDSNEPGLSYHMPDSIIERWNAKQKRSQIYMRNCRPAGTYMEWYENGLLKTRGTYAGGVRTGLWESWFSNGVLDSRESYKAEAPTGVWIYCNYAGEIIKAKVYRRRGAYTEKIIDHKYGVTVVTITDFYHGGASKKTVIEPGSNKTTIERISKKGVFARSVHKSDKDMGRYEYRLTSGGKLKVKKRP